MATLLNFVRRSGWQFQHIDKAKLKEPFQLSAIMFLSYFIGSVIDYFVNLKELISYLYPNTYFLLLDLLTVLFIYNCVNTRSEQGKICKTYLLVGLLCNSLLFLAIQIEVFLVFEGLKSYQPWWFWYVFAVGVNAFDAMMVLVLILHKDFLKLYYLTNKILIR
ncbi:hypothetical protein C1E24_02365 [Pseudoalteromonas phenolica]|uniref:Uncharacterized protein n=1 Tax=Pseudoalteromonas phenolica TaxID=161398 RepID=A0A5R9Q6F3_9GAMM|nr:hypothetical protein [Pseudoalteromonas phenolica]TLX48733.1 hypothetical protein C1E24_02365 [Pseudoalteromonas phenolica]